MGKLLQFKKNGIEIGHPVHGFGFKRDPGQHGRNGFYPLFHQHPVPKLAVGDLPPLTHNLQYAPDVWNQVQTSSCTGHGFACGETGTFAARGRPLASPVRPRFRYAVGRAVDRSDPNQPLVDQGAAPNSLARGASVYGVVLESEDDGGRTASSLDYGQYLQDHINDDPQLGELELSIKRVLVGYNAIADDDPQKSLKVRQALAGGYFVPVAVDAGGDAFQSYDENRGPLGYTGADPDHETCLVDVGTVAAWRAAGFIPPAWTGLSDSQLLYLLQNSWGKNLWTLTGRALVTEDFVQRGCFNTLVCNLL